MFRVAPWIPVEPAKVGAAILGNLPLKPGAKLYTIPPTVVPANAGRVSSPTAATTAVAPSKREMSVRWDVRFMTASFVTVSSMLDWPGNCASTVV